MKRNTSRFVVAVTVTGVLPTLASVQVAAQQAPTATQRVSTRPAGEVLVQIGQSAGVVILADSTIQARLPVPTEPVTPETVEQQLTAMVRLLPPGAVWTKLYVPAPVGGRWVAELVADYARAQARLVGTTGRPAPAGTVELLGRYVPVDRANEYAKALNLTLVYLVTNPPALVTADATPVWSRMSPEQRDLYAQQQAQRLLNLDPAIRREALRQIMLRQAMDPLTLVVKRVMGGMTAAERANLMTDAERENLKR